MLNVLFTNAVAVIIFMSAFFLWAKLRGRIDTVDIAWGLAFIVIAWSSLLQSPSFHSQLIANIVTIWGIRLAYHIYKRHKGRANDPRYDELSKKWKGNFWVRAFVSIFMVQALLALLVSLPVSVATNDQIDAWAWLSIAGTIIWSMGFVIEAVSDYQLSEFLKQKNRPKIMQTGLWEYSRHPNYFGELVQWWAIGLIALQVSYGWVGLLGPLTLSILIIFVSGIPPIERAKARDKDYQAYKKQTSALLPLPKR